MPSIAALSNFLVSLTCSIYKSFHNILNIHIKYKFVVQKINNDSCMCGEQKPRNVYGASTAHKIPHVLYSIS